MGLISIRFRLMLAKRHARTAILHQKQIKDSFLQAGADAEHADAICRYIKLYCDDINDALKPPGGDIKRAYEEAKLNKKAMRYRKKLEKREAKLNKKLAKRGRI